MGIFTPIVPLEFDASFSYIQRLMHLCDKLNEQGVSINSIQAFLNSLDIDKKIKLLFRKSKTRCLSNL